MKKAPAPSYLEKTRVLPTGTAAEKEHVAKFVQAMRTYARTYLERAQKLRLKDRPDWMQNQIELHRAWLKLCNYMDSLNAQRRMTPETLGDLYDPEQAKEVP